jgi:ABC-type nitrate/sulfonate/bicarbonate transport system ATPase subunit
LFRVVLGLEDHNGGLVVRDFDSAGYLPQEGLLFPWKTVLENVELPLVIKGVDKRSRRDTIDAQLEPFGLAGFANAYPQELSGGMQQRAALLRTVITGAPILFLDEPFGALDTITRQRLQDWLAALIQQLERTMLLVTHDLEEALILAERVIVLTERPATVVGEVQYEQGDVGRKCRTGEGFLDAKKTLLEMIEKGA